MVKALLFDMDGLLFDTERIYEETWQLAKKQFGLVSDDKFRDQIRGGDPNNARKVLSKEFGENFPFEEVEKYRKEQFIKIVYDRGIDLKKGAIELLEYAKKNGIKCALATSTVQSKLDHYFPNVKENVFDYFEVIINGSMVAHSKPNPEIFLLAANQLNVLPENCLVLEDSINGIKAAKNGNIPSIMICDLMQPTDEIKDYYLKVCNDLSEVIDVIK